MSNIPLLSLLYIYKKSELGVKMFALRREYNTYERLLLSSVSKEIILYVFSN